MWFCKAYRTISPVLDYLRDFCLAKTLGNSLAIDMSIANMAVPISGSAAWAEGQCTCILTGKVRCSNNRCKKKLESHRVRCNRMPIGYGKSIDRMNTPAGYPHSGHVHLQKAPKQGCSFFMPRLKWRSVEKLERVCLECSFWSASNSLHLQLWKIHRKSFSDLSFPPGRFRLYGVVWLLTSLHCHRISGVMNSQSPSNCRLKSDVGPVPSPTLSKVLPWRA